MTEPPYRRLTCACRYNLYIEVLRGGHPVCRPHVCQ